MIRDTVDQIDFEEIKAAIDEYHEYIKDMIKYHALPCIDNYFQPD